MRVNWDTQFIYLFCTHNNQLFDDLNPKIKLFYHPALFLIHIKQIAKDKNITFHTSVNFWELFQHETKKILQKRRFYPHEVKHLKTQKTQNSSFLSFVQFDLWWWNLTVVSSIWPGVGCFSGIKCNSTSHQSEILPSLIFYVCLFLFILCLFISRNCGEMSSPNGGKEIMGPVCKSGAKILYAWAMDAPDLKLPEGTSVRKLIFCKRVKLQESILKITVMFSIHREWF